MNLRYTFKALIKVRLAAIYLSVMCVALLPGCSEQPSTANHTYIARLANTLAHEPTEISPLQPLKLLPPAPIKQLGNTLSILQLANLSHCRLNLLISEHNNQLGKTATAASTLKYQIAFIQSAEQCLNTLNSQRVIYKKITAATEYKQTNLMHYFNNMLYKEPELNRTWQLSSQELSTAPAGYSDTINAMKHIVAIKQQINAQQFKAINTETLFKALEQLNKYQFNQLLIQSARTQINLNKHASKFLQSVNIAELCPKGKNNRQAQIISNIFKKFYLSQIQPYQAQLSGYLETLQPLYQQLWYQAAVSSPAINNLLDPKLNSNLLAELKSSAKNHVLWWQTFYKTCEIKPI